MQGLMQNMKRGNNLAFYGQNGTEQIFFRTFAPRELCMSDKKFKSV
jgi:hypothetical protein